MNLSKKTLEQSQGKFLVKVKDSLLARDFLDQLYKLVGECQLVRCDDLTSLVDFCSSDSLFGPSKRIAVLNRIEKDDLDALVELVERPSDDILVLFETETLLKTKAYTRLKGASTYLELKEPSESERAVWVRRWMSERGMTFGEEIPGYIVSRSGADLSRLQKEIEKLSFLLAGDATKVVTKGTCDQLVAANNDSQFFVFMENFFRKRLPEVIAEFKKVDEYSYVKLLHFMIGQVDKLYKIAVYKEQGMNLEQLAEVVGIPAFIVKTKMFPALSFYGKMKLVLLSDLLNKLDIELRLTKYPKSLVFETYLVKAFKI